VNRSPLVVAIRHLLIVAAVAVAVCAAYADDAPLRAIQTDRGTNVQLAIESAAKASAPLLEGEPARFTVKLNDATTGAMLGGVYPNVWMVRRPPAGNDDAKRCTAEVATLLTGSVSSPAALDLNIYYVLALNGDGSITVVDPRFGFGGTQLLAMLQLDHPGYDWALAGDNRRLFVSVPESGRVAVVDTVHWKLVANIDAGAEPRRVVASPDGRQLWVATRAGITVLRAADASVAARVPLGGEAGDIAVSDDGRYVVVTSRHDGKATLIDAHANTVLARIGAGTAPTSARFSPLSDMAYIAGEDGVVTVIDPRRLKAIVTIQAQAGPTQVRIAPGGRFAFLPNPVRDVVQIIDTASNRVVQTAAISAGPFDVAFSDDLAYVRRLRSETVQMVPLAAIGKEGAPVPVIDFPAGEQPFGKVPRTTAAAGIAGAPGENAVVIANPSDKQVYYYKEGMAAPIGHFSNYGHSPQAVLVLDRSLRQTGGAYSTTAVLPDAGVYDLAVFVDAPRVVSCFPVTIAENPALESTKRRVPVVIEQLTGDRVIAAGTPAHLAFRLRDPVTKAPRAGIPDAMVLIVQAGGSWFNRQPLTAEDGGRYATEFVPPAAGVYYVYVGCPSLGLRTSNPQFLTLEAR
jgi:DNA-binding beta-propeller fold protein YncE